MTSCSTIKSAQQPLTNLVNNDAAEGDASLPPKSGLEQQTPAGAQGAADDVGLKYDVALGFLRASLDLGAQTEVDRIQGTRTLTSDKLLFTVEQPPFICMTKIK